MRLRHTEKNADLFADGTNKTAEGLVVANLRKYRGKGDALEERTSHDLFEIELNTEKERGRFLS